MPVRRSGVLWCFPVIFSEFDRSSIKKAALIPFGFTGKFSGIFIMRKAAYYVVPSPRLVMYRLA